MLIHREYSNAYPAKLIIEKDCVRTENGNKARGLGTISLTDFVPYPKNPVIASVFKEIGWAEELGSGVRNIVKYSKVYERILKELKPGEKEKNEMDRLFCLVRKIPTPEVCQVILNNYELGEKIKSIGDTVLTTEQLNMVEKLFKSFGNT